MFLQAIWENQFYYLFGFLFLVFIILVVSCSQISIVMVYFQLCAEVRTAELEWGWESCIQHWITGPVPRGWGPCALAQFCWQGLGPLHSFSLQASVYLAVC